VFLLDTKQVRLCAHNCTLEGLINVGVSITTLEGLINVG